TSTGVGAASVRVRWCLVFPSASCPVFSHTCGNIDLALCECGLANCVTVCYLLGMSCY
ncbi:hypothetical protein SRHO_G00226600, partial [Serrasalmus rhombeus]